MTEKQRLLNEMIRLGISEGMVAWYKKRLTAEGLRTVLRNDKALDIITEQAKKAGKARTN